MKLSTWILLILTPFMLTSCSSCIMRQKCEKINWYDHGFQIALKGQRPAEDKMVADCRRVEADIKEADLDRGFKAGRDRYCEPETVYLTGKQGEGFTAEFCDPGSIPALRRKHQEGLNDYCLPSNGRAVGAAGKIYTGRCNKNQEEKFMPEYRIGRIAYLENQIADTNRLQNENQQALSSSQMQLSSLERSLNYVPSPRLVRKDVWDDVQKKMVSREETEDPYRAQRENLQAQVNSERSNLSSLRSKQSELSNKISTLNKELTELKALASPALTPATSGPSQK